MKMLVPFRHLAPLRMSSWSLNLSSFTTIDLVPTIGDESAIPMRPLHLDEFRVQFELICQLFLGLDFGVMPSFSLYVLNFIDFKMLLRLDWFFVVVKPTTL